MRGWVGENETVFQPDATHREGAWIDQYWTSLARYGKNYKEAADAILSAAINRDGIYPDTVVYPAIFMYRHYLELTLKDIIWRAMRLEREGQYNWKKANHRLEVLWLEAKRLLKQHYATKAPKEIDFLDGPIGEFVTYDPTSMAFRYPFDKHGNRHLQDLSHVNLEHLMEVMDRVANTLSCLASDLEQRMDCVTEAECEM